MQLPKEGKKKGKAVDRVGIGERKKEVKQRNAGKKDRPICYLEQEKGSSLSPRKGGKGGW